MTSDLSLKIKIDGRIRSQILSRFGITFDELKECIKNADISDRPVDGVIGESSILAKTHRGRTIEIRYARTSTRKYDLQMQDKIVTMQEEGNFLEILDCKPTFAEHKIDQKLGQSILNPPSETTDFDWGELRRLHPVNSDFGFSTGQPIDRYYIEMFLHKHRQDIRGNVLEIGDDLYSKVFGTDVSSSDILHVQGNEISTLVGNLETGEGIPQEKYDCILLTQTLPFIYDVKAALRNCRRALKPNGVLLATVNGISQISRFDMERWGDFWRFTDLSLTKLLSEEFASYSTTVETYGNFLSSITFLAGLPAQKLTLSELNFTDENYQVLLGARAKNSE